MLLLDILLNNTMLFFYKPRNIILNLDTLININILVYLFKNTQLINFKLNLTNCIQILPKI